MRLPVLLQALAKQSNCFFLNITASSIMSKWLGDANRLVRAVFSLAAKLEPCIIFIGECPPPLPSSRGTLVSVYQLRSRRPELGDSRQGVMGSDYGTELERSHRAVRLPHVCSTAAERQLAGGR
jgi:hypothetical protein